MYDIQTNEEIDAAGLLAKKGYSPDQARDVLALTGDSVDNIPGIPGVGPKTAAKWIAQYGSIDNLIAHKEEIGGKIGETFRANLHVLENSRQLVELQFDVPIAPIDWQAARRPSRKIARPRADFSSTGLCQTAEHARRGGDAVSRSDAHQRGRPKPAAAASGPRPRLPSPRATKAPAKTKSETPRKATAPIGGLFDHLPDEPAQRPTPPPTEADQVTLATAAPEHEMQTDSALTPR